jgi:exopolysaccharide biosynthesis polyprenyl glycosylphosphotransferase
MINALLNITLAREVLRCIDLLLVILSFVLAYTIKSNYLGQYSGLTQEPNYYLILLVLLFYCNFLLSYFKFCEPKQIDSRFRELVRTASIVFLSHSLLILTLYIFHQDDVSRLMIFINGFLLLVFLLIRRGLIVYFVRRCGAQGKNQVRILIIGSRDRAKDTIRAILDAENPLLSIVGCLEVDDTRTGQKVVDEVRVIGDMRQFKFTLLNRVIDEVIFAVPLKKIHDVNDQITFAEKLGVKIRIMPDWQLQKVMFRPETATINFENFVGIPTLSLSSTPKNNLELLVKSFIDYTGAISLILLLSPVLLTLAILVKLSSPGPVIFSQERAGLNGRRFMLYKFRTMVANAEVLRASLETQNEMDGPVFKIKNDPRITRIGKFLRRTSLDELPQLFNILWGDMSLVGPRPPIPDEVEQYLPCQRRRLSMKPGLTCIWQVSSRRNDIPFESWMKMDLKYIDNWCLLLDLKLLLRTLSTVLLGSGR